MNKITWFILGIIPGVFWGTLNGLYDKTWIPSLAYMIAILLFVVIIELEHKQEVEE